MKLIFILIIPLIFGLSIDSEMFKEPLFPLEQIMDPAEPKGSPMDEVPYFKGNGLSPSWRLSISNDSIFFESELENYGSIRAGHLDPVKEGGRKVYSIPLENNLKLNIEIQDESCTIVGSNESFVYSLHVTISADGDSDPKEFSGCGHYLTDRMLEGRWMVKQINGNDVDSDDFNGNVPSLEIQPRRNSFSGFAGCNKINGRIFSERDLLRFTDVVSTKMSCPQLQGEEQFLKALSFSTQFEVNENQLILSNPMKVTLIFEND